MRPSVQIEHELAKCTLHACQAFLQDDEARARQLCSEFEIHLAERFAQFEMLFGREGVVALLAVRVMLDVATGIGAIRHIVEWYIGNLR